MASNANTFDADTDFCFTIYQNVDLYNADLILGATDVLVQSSDQRALAVEKYQSTAF